MNRISDHPPHDEQIIELLGNGPSNTTLEKRGARSQHIGDRVTSEGRDDSDAPQLGSPIHSAPSPSRDTTSSNLYARGNALWTQFMQSRRNEDLDEAISLHRQALTLRPAFHPERFWSLNNLACILQARITQSSRHEDVEEVSVLLREALELRPPSHPERPLSLFNLARALSTRFMHFGLVEDLAEAIELHRQAIALQPSSHPGRSLSLNNLASTLLTQFSLVGRREDLEDAISLYRQALELQPLPHEDRSCTLTNLACALSTRFKQSGQREDLEEATRLLREALHLRPPPHPDRSWSLDNLASNLVIQFEHSGCRDDLEEGICLHQDALELRPGSHQERPSSLNNLACALRMRFRLSGRQEDLEKSTLLHREALKMRHESHPARSFSLYNLGRALLIQFEQSGRREELEEAIYMSRQSLQLRPASHPDRSFSLDNLAYTLHARFKLSGRQRDLEEAISFFREALQLRPATHLHRSLSLNNLAATLFTNSQQPGHSLEHLDEAILLHREAIEPLTPSHPDLPTFLSNLSVSLLASLRREDLEEGIMLNRQVLELLPEHHPDRPLYLHNLADAILTKFNSLKGQKDIEESIDVSSQCLNVLNSGHPLSCQYFSHQALIFRAAYLHTNKSQYLHKAMDSYQVAVACNTAPVSQRFQVAKEWIENAEYYHEPVVDAYHAAIRLLPRLAMLGLDLPSRHEALTSGSDGLAREAAAYAIQANQYDKAVELLEEGRAVFWSQALQVRTPMTDLRDIAPELAEKLRRISLALEQGSVRDVSRILSDDTSRLISMEQEAAHFLRLNDQWLETLEEVRQLEGFQNFLRPCRISTLLGAAKETPLVIINASKIRCDALILTSNGVQHVPFLDLTLTDVNQLAQLLRSITVPGSRNVSLPESNQTTIQNLIHQMPSSDTMQPLKQTLERGALTSVPWSDVVFRHVLATLWKSVVKPVIWTLGLKKSDMPSPLRWCPTGPFAFLPIHAAGLYETQESECITDYVISSYTPTISALLRDTSSPSTTFKMLVVIQPELRHTVTELERIEARVTKARITDLVKLISGTAEEVTSQLSNASIAHFACHGRQDAENPLQSALSLREGHSLTLSQIMQQSIPNAKLAFLAACQTATGDTMLPDEVIHLGSTLLFAGFPGVVATMWNIHDADGPEVADAFYEYLFEEVNSDTGDTLHPDTTRAARALHFAVAKLRSEKNVSFKRWVPFIHLGN